MKLELITKTDVPSGYTPVERVEKTLLALSRAGENRLEREMLYGKAVAELRASLNDPESLYKVLDRQGLNIIGTASDIKTSRLKMRTNEITTYIWLHENWDAITYLRNKGILKATTGPAVRRDWRSWVDAQYKKKVRRKGVISETEWALAEERIRTAKENRQQREARKVERVLETIARNLTKAQRREVYDRLRKML